MFNIGKICQSNKLTKITEQVWSSIRADILSEIEKKERFKID